MTNRRKFLAALAALPIAVKAPVKYQQDLKLEPVGLDANGKWVRLVTVDESSKVGVLKFDGTKWVKVG
jgi:hypothetical protein